MHLIGINSPLLVHLGTFIVLISLLETSFSRPDTSDDYPVAPDTPDAPVSNCLSECRNSSGYSNWCYVNTANSQWKLWWGNWVYCDPTKVPAIDGTTTAYGIPCKDACEKKHNGKLWCSTPTWKSYDWDYCSPTPKEDYVGAKCSGKCDYHGEKYKWCELEGGSWGYCSHRG